jgi:ADP-ribosylglycohydrolase
VGDAFGQQFFLDETEALAQISQRRLPPGPWEWTDDTEMALGIVAMLRGHGEIEQQQLARLFAEGMQRPEYYGAGAQRILDAIAKGRDWRAVSQAAFNGRGSFGNGAAMRIPPLGAYFADCELSYVAEQARLSSEVTHAHEEGIAGGVAVACAAAMLWQTQRDFDGRRWLQQIHELTPKGYTRDGIATAVKLFDAEVREAAEALGNGAGISAPDTVPFCLWSVARYGNDFEELMWRTVSALGDRDTTCAIAGGLGALLVGEAGIPGEWRESREPLPE